MHVVLRPAGPADISFFYRHQSDPAARLMAAFVQESEWPEFVAKWQAIMNNDAMPVRTVLCDGEVAGYVAHFQQLGRPSISYWFDSRHWGRGLATTALRMFLPTIEVRPLYARVVDDNAASLRVLDKCGFRIVGRERDFAQARGAEVCELVLRLD